MPQAKFVDRDRAAGFQGVKHRGSELVVFGLHVHRPVKLFFVQLESQYAVVAGGNQEQLTLMDTDAAAIDEVGVAARNR